MNDDTIDNVNLLLSLVKEPNLNSTEILLLDCLYTDLLGDELDVNEICLHLAIKAIELRGYECLKKQDLAKLDFWAECRGVGLVPSSMLDFNKNTGIGIIC